MTSKLFSVLIFFVAINASANGETPQEPLFGYGSSDAVIPAKDQELFYTGFEAGFEERYGARIPKNLVAIAHVYNGTQLGAVDSAHKLLKRNVKALIGFPTSHEALLAAKIARDAKVFALFPAASHSSIASFGPSVYSTGESMEAGVRKALGFLEKKFRRKNGVVIYSPYAVYSTDQKEIFLRLALSPAFSELKIKYVPLSADLTLSPVHLAELRRDPPAYIYLTQYASEATSVMAQLESKGIDLPIITNSSWLTGDIEFVRRFLAPRKAPLYSVGVWLKGSPQSKKFEGVIRKKYGIEPTPEIAYGYDLGTVIATVYNDVKASKNITSEMIRDAFVKRRCFTGTSAGELCFGPNGGHAQREVQFVEFTKTGFVRVE
jgi:ABC-type branched-subunit amino acid transport system substrate-binding protein